MGKAHRGCRLGESETAIQREALPNLLSPSHQANQIHQGRQNIECKRGSSLFDQTPPHENIRGSSEGVGNQTWISCTVLRSSFSFVFAINVVLTSFKLQGF